MIPITIAGRILVECRNCLTNKPFKNGFCQICGYDNTLTDEQIHRVDHECI